MAVEPESGPLLTPAEVATGHPVSAASLLPADVIHLPRQQLRGQLAGPDVDVDRFPVRNPGGRTCVIWWHDHLRPEVTGATVLACTAEVQVIAGPHAVAGA